MKIYGFELSGHAHRARLMVSLLDLPVELEEVELPNGAHKQPAYLAINPFGQVPALTDGDVTLFDSNAIIVYLATQYDPSRTWYPTDPEAIAHIQSWLSKASRELAEGPAAARRITVFGAELDKEKVIGLAHNLFQIMESHLQGRAYFVGDHPTVADVAMYTYTAHAPEGGVDLKHYQNILAWLARVEALPGFIPMTATETAAKADCAR